MRGIGQRGLAGDQVRLAFHHRVNDLEVIGLERAARLRDFNNGVGQHGRLDFGRAPTEFHLYLHAFRCKVALGHFDEFRSDDLAFEIFGLLEAAGFRHGEYPADLAPALLGIGQRGHAGDVEAALDYPIDAGESGIEHAVIDVARHLLRANEHALDVDVVDRRKVGAAVGVDVPSCALEERDGRILQAAFGNSESKLAIHGSPPRRSQWAA